MRPNVTIHHRRTVLVAALALTVLAGGAMFAYAQGDAEPRRRGDRFGRRTLAA
jgi:hypothetical protein